MDEYDAIAELGALLQEAGATVTFDSERNNQHPCFACGVKPEGAHKLVDLKFVVPLPERVVTRPFCTSCINLGEPAFVTEREVDQRTIQRLQEQLRKHS